jgi:hypothetical protein
MVIIIIIIMRDDDKDNTNNRPIAGVAREHKKIREVTNHKYNK